MVDPEWDEIRAIVNCMKASANITPFRRDHAYLTPVRSEIDARTLEAHLHFYVPLLGENVLNYANILVLEIQKKCDVTSP